MSELYNAMRENKSNANISPKEYEALVQRHRELYQKATKGNPSWDKYWEKTKNYKQTQGVY